MTAEKFLTQEKLKMFKQKSCLTRKTIIEMIHEAKSGHPGGSLSAVELIVPLYYGIIKHDPSKPDLENRDRVIFSKGHAAPLQYSILGNLGYFDKKELKTLRKFGSILQGHPDSNLTPGIECSTGSLGHGLSIATGMALAGKIDNKDYRIYCLCGDGELQEGEIWEAVMSAAHYKLDNFTIIVDNNGLQIDGKVTDVMNVYPISEKFESFGCNVINIDGHDLEQVINAYFEAMNTKGKPTAIIAKTKKGMGINFMEDEAGWHGKAPSKEEALKALGIIKEYGKQTLLCAGECEECE